MKTINIFRFILFGLCFLLASCMEEDPYADFSVSTTQIEPGESVTFTNKSTNADHYEWFFGDGGSSTEANPTHTYSEMGAYLVTLVAYSKSGNKKDDAYFAFIMVIEPTKLTFNVYMNSSPLSNCQVVLFDDYNDWYNDVNSVATGYTNTSGKITFTGCSNIVYYADFYYNSTYYSTGVTEQLTLYEENIYNVYLSNRQVIFNNTTHTPITIDVTGFATRTIPVGESTTYQVSGSSITYSASTTETYSNGNPLALTLYWNNTISLSNDVTTRNLVVGSTYSFIYFRNDFGTNLGPIYTNYGNSSYQVIVNTSIPSDNVDYRIGYHHARYDTEVRAYYNSGYYYCYWYQGVHFSFPFTDNQEVHLWMAGKSASNIAEEKLFVPDNMVETTPLRPFEKVKPMYKKSELAENEYPTSYSNN